MTTRPFQPAEVFAVLERYDVRYVLIGGLAGRAWGSPSVTRDVDVAPDRSGDNLERLAAALRELHARLRLPGHEEVPFQLDAESLRRGLNFTFATDAGDVDVLGQPAGVDGYAELAPNAVPFDLGGTTVAVVDLDDLIRMKVAAGRPKDRIEVEVLAAVREERERRGVPPGE
jgi:hypothetical protein